MSTSLKLVTPPAAEPVTLAEVKAWAKIDGDDDDALIASLIAAARQAAEDFTRRAFITQAWRLTLDLEASAFGRCWAPGFYELPATALDGGLPNIIRLPRPPIISIASVKTYDTADTESTFDPANYRLDADGGRLILSPAADWPSNLRPQGAVAIQYSAGYGGASDVPQAIKSVLLMHIQRMYDGRIVCDMPPDCQRLLQPYRVMSVANG